mmetsp:Transcript_29123/g.100465  ORF Transcript_29123/g.100465 Transcript_29123/m.100465 type:complete len:318 (-) Transcript_29123:75-1028(-)
MLWQPRNEGGVVLQRRARKLQRKAVLRRRSGHDGTRTAEAVGRELQRQAALAHGGEDDVLVVAQRRRSELERRAVLLHGRESGGAVASDALRRELQSAAAVPDRFDDEFFGVSQRRRSKGQSAAVCAHRGERDSAVVLHGRAGELERETALAHGRGDDVSVAFEFRRSKLEVEAVLAARREEDGGVVAEVESGELEREAGRVGAGSFHELFVFAELQHRKLQSFPVALHGVRDAGAVAFQLVWRVAEGADGVGLAALEEARPPPPRSLPLRRRRLAWCSARAPAPQRSLAGGPRRRRRLRLNGARRHCRLVVRLRRV